MAALEFVTAGEVIPTEQGFLRGHGTFVRGGKLIASLCGVVERVNKLVSVRPRKARYQGEIGDVVIGRVTDVADKRWKVDINGRQDAVLMLSSVNLPGGVQRRRTVQDSLQMRSFFSEGDLISAEVQNIMGDGAVSLHTRSLKYGKLAQGLFVRVASVLVRRSKQHFHSLPCGVDVILGNNGFVWISPPRDTEEVDVALRERMARVRNAVVVLDAAFLPIVQSTVVDVYDHSLALGLTAHDMLAADVRARVTQTVVVAK